jgi:diguanylate cyclase (GGDEF)-like protein
VSPTTRLAVRFVVLVALYLAGATMGAWFVTTPDQVVLIWPPAGIGYAALLIYGLRWWPFIALAVLLHLTFNPVPALFIPYSIAANTLSALAGAWVVLRWAPDVVTRLEVRSGFVMLLGGLLLVTSSSLIGVAGMTHSGMLLPEQWPPAMAKWAMADLFGVLAVAPAVLIASGWKARLRAGFSYGGASEKLVWALALVLSLGAVLWAGSHSAAYALGLASLPLGLVLWSAARFEPLYAALATLALALFVSVVAGFGLGGFDPPQSLLDTAILIAFMCVMAIVPQMIAAAIHETRVASWRLVRRASFDPLTRLANRTAFDEQARRIIWQARDEPMALAYLDLDQFKVVNDTVSHATGDELIRELAGALRLAVERDDLLARTGGDEFAVLMRRVAPEQAVARAGRLREAVAAFRFAAGNHVLATSASVGVVAFRGGREDFDALLADVDAACFTSKELGGNRVQVTSPHESVVSERTTAMRWVPRVTEAIEQDRIRLHCQTIAPIRGDPALGRHFEILIRLHDPASDELLPPGAFVAAAERFGLGVRLDRHVLDRVLGWLETHPAEAATVELCSINLSAAALVDEDFAAFVERRLHGSAVPAHRLCFEITETSVVRDLARAQRFIQRVRALGCRFALDDFGSGFCSFAYLKSLDVDYFKIDGSFVRDAPHSPLAHAVVRAIAEIARVTAKRTIAEYVESEAIRNQLLELEVDYAQGYAIDRPTPIEQYFVAPAPDPLAPATALAGAERG